MDMPGGAGRPADLITRPSIREVAAVSIYVGQPGAHHARTSAELPPTIDMELYRRIVDTLCPPW